MRKKKSTQQLVGIENITGSSHFRRQPMRTVYEVKHLVGGVLFKINRKQLQ